MSDPRLASSRLYPDVERLRAQVGLTWEKELALLRQLGLRDGLVLADLGSGPGFVAERLLSALPTAHVTAVDLDPYMAGAARERLAPFGSRSAVVEASLTSTGLEDDAFDVALARFVFQHLHAPDLAADEMLRLLKPGGLALAIDVDDACAGFVAPGLRALEIIGPKVAALQAAHAGDRFVGRKLWGLMAGAGFAELAVHAIAVSSAEVGLEAFRPQYDPGRYRPFVRPGGLSEQEWQAYAAEAEQFFATPEAFILQVYLAVGGRKPRRS